MAIVTVDATKVRPLFGSQTIRKVMGEASKIGRVCYIESDELLYQAAGGTNALATHMLGIIVSGSKADKDGDVVAGETVDFLIFGRVAFPGSAFDPQVQYYLADETSSVRGLIGNAAGTVTRRLGKPESADVFFFNAQDVASVSG